MSASLVPIRVGKVVFHDARTPDPQFDLQAGYSKYEEILNHRRDRMRAYLGGEEPGCEQMRVSVARELYHKYRRGGGAMRYPKWLKSMEDVRTCPDRKTPEAFLFLGFRGMDQVPIGGIGLYSIDIINVHSVHGTAEVRLMTYRAMCSPMVQPPKLASSFMRILLDGPVAAWDRDNNRIRTQLVQWRFPRRELRNRWAVDSPLASEYMSDWGQHDLTLEQGNGVMYPVTLDRVAP